MNGVIIMREKDLRTHQNHAAISNEANHADCSWHITERQVRKIFKRHQELGDQGVVSRKLGKTNRKLSEVAKAEVLKLISKNYSDFGSTLAGCVEKFPREDLRKRPKIKKLLCCPTRQTKEF